MHFRFMCEAIGSRVVTALLFLVTRTRRAPLAVWRPFLHLLRYERLRLRLSATTDVSMRLRLTATGGMNTFGAVAVLLLRCRPEHVLRV